MLRPVGAVLVALVFLGAWLGLIAYQAGGSAPAMVATLADSADRNGLAGLAAQGYLAAARLVAQELHAGRVAPDSARGQELLEAIVGYRCAAARLLLEGGHPRAAEAVALEAAQAQYNDVAARALLLEARSSGEATQAAAARRELMVLLLRGEQPEVLYALGQALLRTSAADEAEGYLQRAAQRGPQHVPSRLALAETALGRGELQAARAWLTSLARIPLTPSESRAFQRLDAETRPEPYWRPTRLVVWASEHGVSALMVVAFLAVLFSPTLTTLVARRRSGM